MQEVMLGFFFAEVLEQQLTTSVFLRLRKQNLWNIFSSHFPQ